MPIDETTYQDFQKEMTRITKGLSPLEQVRVIQAKLLEYLSRNGVDELTANSIRRVARALFEDDFGPFLDQVFRRFGQVITGVNALYGDLGDDIVRDAGIMFAVQEAHRRQFGDYAEQMALDIEEATFRAVRNRSTVEQLEQRFIQLGGKAEVYASTLAKTQLRVTARVAKGEKARTAGVFFYQYVGGVRGVTRPFCAAMAGTTLHIDTIHELRNGNKEPVFENCGGWNCVHDWEPDPFAEEADTKDLIETESGSGRVVLAGGDQVLRRFHEHREVAA